MALASLGTVAALAAPDCQKLASFAMPHVSVSASRVVAAGEFTIKSLPAFCRVEATLHPSNDSDIRIEVWLPLERWNTKLQGVGNGAWAGVISTSALATALTAGYAGVSGDAGHQGNEPTFLQGHPEKLIDFAYRGVHEMTVAAKAIVAAFYGEAPKYSYFNGCSTGGRQALTEVQRFPDDYDGIIAGDPVNDSSRIQSTQLWFWQTFHKNEAANLPPDKLKLLHDAVMKSCDALDGVKDGVLEDPTRCGYDPTLLQCPDNDAPTCLTAAQVETAKLSYVGPMTARGGQPIYPGREWGSELGWVNHSGPQPSDYATGVFRAIVMKDPQWDFHSFDIERDLPVAQKAMQSNMDAVDRNLRPFFAHGGKLIQYHGWNDPGVPPQGSVNYYRAVSQTTGTALNKTQDSYRLFMVPGMGHCGGGDGTSRFNMIAALEEWVEQGKAPDRIEASRERNGVVDRTRPLCPYPQVAAYLGSGSTDEAHNFSCRIP